MTRQEICRSMRRIIRWAPDNAEHGRYLNVNTWHSAHIITKISYQVIHRFVIHLTCLCWKLDYAILYNIEKTCSDILSILFIKLLYKVTTAFKILCEFEISDRLRWSFQWLNYFMQMVFVDIICGIVFLVVITLSFL